VSVVQKSPLRRERPVPRAPAHKPKGAAAAGKQGFRLFPRSSSAIDVVGPAGKGTTNSTPVTNLGRQMQGVLNVSSPIGKGRHRAFSANGFARVTSAEKQQQVHGSSFRRMPAHLVALDASRRVASKTVPQPLFKDRHSKEKINKARAHCQTLKQHVETVASQVDFTALDRIAVCRGEEALRSLREQLEQLDYLANCFLQMITGRDQRQNPGQRGTNSIQIKSSVVSLQAVISKIPEELDAETAEQIIQVVDQGLLEQMLSWVGEIETGLEAVRLCIKSSMPVAQPSRPLAPSQKARPEQPAVRRKFISGPAGAKRNRSSENDSPQESPDLVGVSERRPAKKDRMQRMRPPPLVVPESS